MVKLTVVVMLVMGFVAAVLAAPASDYQLPELSESAAGYVAEESPEPEEHFRFRRVTCDLLSAGGFVGDTACAANCLSMGKAGGSCSGGICQCRKTTFKKLWDDRFG